MRRGGPVTRREAEVMLRAHQEQLNRLTANPPRGDGIGGDRALVIWSEHIRMHRAGVREMQEFLLREEGK